MDFSCNLEKVDEFNKLSEPKSAQCEKGLMLECENEIKGIVKKVVKVAFTSFLYNFQFCEVIQRIRRATNSIEIKEAGQTATEKIERATPEKG